MELKDLATQLGLTWLDEEMTKTLTRYMNQGETYLKRYDPEADFSTDELASLLLVEFCRYALSNAIDDFGKNYAEEILSFHHAYLVRKQGDDDAQT